MATTMDYFEKMHLVPNSFADGLGAHRMSDMSATPPLDSFDQYPVYDSEPYTSGDEVTYTQDPLAHQLMLKSISYPEDPFTQPSWTPDERAPDTPSDGPSSDPESKYLSFAATSQVLQLFDQSYQPCKVDIQAQLHGMFFLAESQWPGCMEGVPPQSELTCYRRNLFQITGHVVMPQNLRYVAAKDGRRSAILGLELAVTATESVEGNPIKLVSVPWKTQSGIDSPNAEEKIDKEPTSIVLAEGRVPGVDSDSSTTAFQWKRMQFRIATANNGRRRELQQHFNLHLRVLATISTGEKLCIARSQSSAIIVRGRSPRNFAARKDIPLSNTSMSRKHLPSLSRSHGSSHSTTSTVSLANQGSTPRDDVPHPHLSLPPSTAKEQEIDLNGWQPYPFYFPSQNPTPTALVDSPSPSSQSAFDFHFAPHELIATKDVSPSVYYDSGDEATNAYITRHFTRRSSRPPTSNPSPDCLEQGRRCYMDASAIPVFPSEDSTTAYHPRTYLYQSSFPRAAPMSVPFQHLPRAPVARSRGTGVVNQTLPMTSSPQLITESELIYKDLSHLYSNNDQDLVDSNFRRQPTLACQHTMFTDVGQLDSRRKKRHHSEINV